MKEFKIIQYWRNYKNERYSNMNFKGKYFFLDIAP